MSLYQIIICLGLSLVFRQGELALSQEWYNSSETFSDIASYTITMKKECL